MGGCGNALRSSRMRLVLALSPPASVPYPHSVTRVCSSAERVLGRKKHTMPDRKNWYPTEDKIRPRNKGPRQGPCKLKEGLTPGAVLILVAGKYKGKRVIFLKQLESGYLLVTGPFNVNGVPVRRVNQIYAIVTSTKVNLPKLDLSGWTDAYFKKDKPKSKKKAGQEGFFEAEKEQEKKLPADFVDRQKKLDAAIMPALKGYEEYLKSPFSLQAGDRPHLMKF